MAVNRKQRQVYEMLKSKAQRYYRLNKLINRAFNGLKAKWTKAKLLEACYQ